MYLLLELFEIVYVRLCVRVDKLITNSRRPRCGLGRGRVSCSFIGLQKIFSGDARLSTNSPERRRFYSVMIRYCHRGFRAISICPFQRDVLLFPDHAEPQRLKGLYYFLFWRINRKLRYRHYTPASATKASRIGGSTSRTDGPKVSM